MVWRSVSRQPDSRNRPAEEFSLWTAAKMSVRLKNSERPGWKPDLHIVATECGIVKNGMEEPRFDEIERLAGVVIGAIRDR